jgi:hypothetical protein
MKKIISRLLGLPMWVKATDELPRPIQWVPAIVENEYCVVLWCPFRNVFIMADTDMKVYKKDIIWLKEGVKWKK